ncbi:hypothetical protein N825_10840 [Skermanella stibiiresistens SB22]|uniref:Uncharacterized protein n=1 Tax=Skermanella stibiiresistens SB22 TaxID=1385369 RepID=W9H251_9PROT|nr:hypothetical protein N825_10840 [Skermanella stibiiresistens SB22]
MALTARDSAEMAQLQDVVARHLLRFALLEQLAIHSWVA